MLDDPLLLRFHSADATEERERLTAEDEPVMHSSYEFMPDDWWLDLVPGLPAMDQVITHHRSANRSPWELWHTALRRDSSDPLELGTDLISNTALESLLGITEWDPDGNPLDITRSAILEPNADGSWTGTYSPHPLDPIR